MSALPALLPSWRHRPLLRSRRPASGNPSWGPTPRSLERWMELKSDPAWRYRPYSAPKSRTVARPPRGELTEDIVRYEYNVTMDRRSVREPVALEEFLTRKHDPKWKYKPYRAPRLRALSPLTAKERTRITRELEKRYGNRP